MSQNIWSLKIILLGSPYVGKTSLRRSYMGEKFEKDYLTTIGADFSFKQIELDSGGEVHCSLWDLAGQDIYQKIHPRYYIGAAAAILVYDVLDKNSKKDLNDWVERYIKHSNKDQGFLLLVGNKIDLIEKEDQDKSKIEHQKLVDDLKIRFPNFTFQSILTSAKSGENVDNGILEFLTLIISEYLDSGKRVQIEYNVHQFVPAAYAIAFHEVYGPRIISKSPLNESLEYSEKEFEASIKISSLITFEDLLDLQQITGSFPWLSPDGLFHYIAFILQNPKSRGGRALYILGVVIPKETEPLFLENSIIIYGYLHNKMNAFTKLLKEHKRDYVTDTEVEVSFQEASSIEELLLELRNQVLHLIQ